MSLQVGQLDGYKPNKALYPKLLEISMHSNLTVREMKEAHRNTNDWGENCHINLNMSTEGADDLMIQLENLRLNLLDDEYQWQLTANGIFLTKSNYNFLRDGGFRTTKKNHIWKVHCPARVRVSMWFAYHRKILTKSELRQKKLEWKILLVSSVKNQKKI